MCLNAERKLTEEEMLEECTTSVSVQKGKNYLNVFNFSFPVLLK